MRASTILPLIVTGLLVSCESEPDRQPDQPDPTTGDLSVWSYPDGRHVTGDLTFVVSDGDFPGLSRIEGYVDDEFVGFRDGLPTLDMTIDTRVYAEGDHAVTLLVQTRDAKTEYRYRGALVFDETPPSPARLLSLEPSNGLPVLAWQRNEDANFAAYRIRRTGVGAFEDEVIDIHAREVTEYVDTSLPPNPIGVRLEYSVAIFNGHEAGAQDARLVTLGDLLDLAPYPGLEPVASPTEATFFMVDAGAPNRLVVVSATTQEVVAEHETDLVSKALACAPDGRHLLYADTKGLQILDAQTLAPGPARSFAKAAGAAYARDGRLFVARDDAADAAVYVFDEALEPLTTIPIEGAPPRWVAVSDDATKLFVINANPRTNPLGSLLLYDIETQPATRVKSWDLADGFVKAAIAPDGNRAYLGYTRAIDVLNRELNFLERLPFTNEIQSLATTATALYVSSKEPIVGSGAPRIDRIARTTLTVTDTWSLAGTLRNLVVTTDGGRVYGYIPSPLAQMIGFDAP